MYDLAHYMKLVSGETGGDVDSRFDPRDVVNEAGIYFFNMHDWKFLDRTPLEIDTVADQEYIDLPADFGRILDVVPKNTLIKSVSHVNLQHLQWLRNGVEIDHFNVRLSVSFPVPDANADANTGHSISDSAFPRLELYPAPTATEVGAYHLVYAPRWVPLVDNHERPIIPDYAQSAFIMILRAHAQSYGSPGTLARAIDEVASSDILRAAKASDAGIQREHGQMRGTHLRGGRMGTYRFFDDVDFGAP